MDVVVVSSYRGVLVSTTGSSGAPKKSSAVSSFGSSFISMCL